MKNNENENVQNKIRNIYVFPKNKLIDIIKNHAETIKQIGTDILLTMYYYDEEKYYGPNAKENMYECLSFYKTDLQARNIKPNSISFNFIPICGLINIIINDISDKDIQDTLDIMLDKCLDKIINPDNNNDNNNNNNNNQKFEHAISELCLLDDIFGINIKELLYKIAGRKGMNISQIDDIINLLNDNSDTDTETSNNATQLDNRAIDYSYLRRITKMQEVNNYDITNEVKSKLLQQGALKNIEKIVLFLTKTRESPHINKIEKARLDFERASFSYEDLCAGVIMCGNYQKFVEKVSSNLRKRQQKSKDQQKSAPPQPMTLENAELMVKRTSEAYKNICNNFNGVF